jgi:hypothetical protein
MAGKTSLLVTVWFPGDKATEVGKILVKSLATPFKYVKRVGEAPYATSTEAGMKSVTIYEIEDEKLADGLREITRYLIQFATAIPGYRYQAEFLVTGTEALSLVGLKAPTK